MDKSTTEAFPHIFRIVRASEYRALYKSGRKVHSEKLVLFCRANSIGHTRLGITVSRKVGGAVIRNRIKRLLREIFRRSISHLPNQFDIVVNAKSGCVGASYEALRDEFLSTANKGCR